MKPTETNLFKRLLPFLLLASTLWAGTYTTRSGLFKPDDGATGWGEIVRDNYDIIDSSFAILGATQTFTGYTTFVSSISISSMTVDRLWISTPTYNGTEKLVVNGTTKLFGPLGAVLSLCDQNGANCQNQTVGQIDAATYGVYIPTETVGRINTYTPAVERPLTIIGTTALDQYKNLPALHSGGHVAVGYGALTGFEYGTEDTGVGDFACAYLTTGIYNTCLGALSGSGSGGGNEVYVASHSIFIGANTGPTSSNTIVGNSAAIGYLTRVNLSNALVLGTNIEDAASFGVGPYNVGIGTDTPRARLHINGNFRVDNGSVTVQASTTTAYALLLGTSPTLSGTDNNVSISTQGYVSITSTGTGKQLYIVPQGNSGNAYQDQTGAVTVEKLSGVPTEFLVIHDSTTDNQLGMGLFELWEDQGTSGHNDPLMWIHNNGNASNPFMRVDDNAPDLELVCTSTDNAHGWGKWEPMAISLGGVDLQVNNRAYDNSTFETLAYWHPLSKKDTMPGLNIRSQNSDEDGAVITSSDTAGVTFFTLNSRTVGLTGPTNPPSSYNLGLPQIPITAGQMLYFQANRGGNFTVRQTTWTQADFLYSPTTGVSVSTITATARFVQPTYTKAQLAARTPTIAGEQAYCSDCANCLTAISTSTALGAWASQQATNRTTACN